MDNLSLVSDYLSTYQGRDKLLRTLSYAAKLASGIPYSEETVEKLKKFGSEMSSCRVILRLLDDIPAWHDALSFDWSKKVCYISQVLRFKFCIATKRKLHFFLPTSKSIYSKYKSPKKTVPTDYNI